MLEVGSVGPRKIFSYFLCSFAANASYVIRICCLVFLDIYKADMYFPLPEFNDS
jgi:hypothetical protein